jgi:hypothetical protein
MGSRGPAQRQLRVATLVRSGSLAPALTEAVDLVPFYSSAGRALANLSQELERRQLRGGVGGGKRGGRR